MGKTGTRATRVEKEKRKERIHVHVESITGNETALPNEKVTFTVNRYNTYQVEESEKDKIRWAVKVDREQKNIPFARGETIKLEMKNEWEGKEIVVMAKHFFGKFSETVSQKTKVGEPKVTEIFWSYGEDHKRLSDKSRFYVDMNLHVKTKNYNDGDTVNITLKNDDEQPLFGTTQKLNLSGTVSNNEVIFENVLRDYTLNI